jgi:Tfp pilus assembly protein PilN
MSDESITALVLRDEVAEWTVSQLRKGRREIVQQKSARLDWPAEIEDHRSPEASVHLKTKLPPITGMLGLTVPAERVLMRVVELPSVDSEELMGMAELQVDKFSPFPTDQMSIAIEILQQTEEHSRVLIAAVQEDYIDQIGGFVNSAGLFPEALDVDVLGWWTLLRDERMLLGSGQEIVVIHDDHCAQLIVARDEVPLMIRALDASLPVQDAAFARELADEIEYTLVTMEAGWGAEPLKRLTLCVKGAMPTSTLQALQDDLSIEIKCVDLDALPPLSEGINRRLASPESASMNLAPPSWRDMLASRQLQRKAALIGGVSLLVWLVLMGGLWFFSSDQKSRLTAAQADINRLQAEVVAVRELRGQYESLEAYADRSHSTLECLREVAQLLPDGVDITSFVYNKAAAINLRGEAANDGPINDFIARLEDSGLFENVTTEGISTTSRGGRTRSQFRLTMTLPGGEEDEEAGTSS